MRDGDEREAEVRNAAHVMERVKARDAVFVRYEQGEVADAYARVRGGIFGGARERLVARGQVLHILEIRMDRVRAA